MPSLTSLLLPLLALAGAVTWTLLEYLIHRWMGHDARYRRSLFGKEHTRHHIEGDYFAPTWKKLIFALLLAVVTIPTALLLVGGLGAAYVGGLLVCYVGYELLHRREHTHAGIGRYGRWARRHHFFHHFVDGKSNFGVTTPMWDLAFGTYRRPAAIKVPAKLAMPWLRDRRTGSVVAAYADTFVLPRS